ncbi:hypothetical protein OROMI_030420 [Orobanche minor]
MMIGKSDVVFFFALVMSSIRECPRVEGVDRGGVAVVGVVEPMGRTCLSALRWFDYSYVIELSASKYKRSSGRVGRDVKRASPRRKYRHYP